MEASREATNTADVCFYGPHQPKPQNIKCGTPKVNGGVGPQEPIRVLLAASKHIKDVIIDICIANPISTRMAPVIVREENEDAFPIVASSNRQLAGGSHFTVVAPKQLFCIKGGGIHVIRTAKQVQQSYFCFNRGFLNKEDKIRLNKHTKLLN